MALSFRAKLLATHVGLAVLVAAIAIVALDRSLGAHLEAQLERRLERQVRGAAEWVSSGRHPERLAARLSAVVGARVTIFDSTGRIVGDSERPGIEMPTLDEPHEPPEVRAALKGRLGHARRVATLSGVPTYFVAAPADDGMVVRLGVPRAEIDGTVAATRRRLLFAGGLAAASALLFGLLASRMVTRPLARMIEAAGRLARGDYDVRLHSTSPDELGVLSRTLDTLAAELASKIGRLQRLERTRRDFVANASHELRTPVTAIRGYAETLLSGGGDEATRRRFLEIIHRHGERMGRLVEDLLRLSELEAAPPEDAPREPMDIAAIAACVAETVRTRAEAARMRVLVDVPPGTVAVGSPPALEQVLENLIDNALKYARRPDDGEDGGEIRVAARRESDRVVVTVSDDGPGVPPEHLPRLFERFYRVDAGRSRDLGGTGLGLAIVKHLVERMGGTISVSSPGGLSFRIELLAVSETGFDAATRV